LVKVFVLRTVVHKIHKGIEYIILAAACSPTSGFEVKRNLLQVYTVHIIPTTTTTTMARQSDCGS